MAPRSPVEILRFQSRFIDSSADLEILDARVYCVYLDASVDPGIPVFVLRF